MQAIERELVSRKSADADLLTTLELSNREYPSLIRGEALSLDEVQGLLDDNTTLVEYFYREALRIQESQGLGHAELEAAFRYPGPKPQNRENGILMLADAVESSSRAMKDPAPSSLSKLVHDLLMKRLLDGQFEQSGLTLTELHLIEESLCKSLLALYHARIKYPDDQTQQIA